MQEILDLWASSRYDDRKAGGQILLTHSLMICLSFPSQASQLILAIFAWLSLIMKPCRRCLQPYSVVFLKMIKITLNDMLRVLMSPTSWLSTAAGRSLYNKLHMSCDFNLFRFQLVKNLHRCLEGPFSKHLQERHEPHGEGLLEDWGLLTYLCVTLSWYLSQF